MTGMPSNLPRSIDPVSLGDDPLVFFANARSRFGDAVIISDEGPLFSPAVECPGVVAFFGSHYHRQVLGDYESFISVGSTARAQGLPENVVNLTRSLHSMRCRRQHAAHKAVLAGLITPALLVKHQASIFAAVDTFVAAWREAGSIPIFAGMRSLIAEIAVIMLFGQEHPSRGELQLRLAQHFDARRLLGPNQAGRAAAAEIGNILDAALGSAIAAPYEKKGLAGRLAAELGDIAARAHINVLFMSMAEPVAVATTWLLLVLSQLPCLRREMREAYLERAPRSTLPVVIDHAVLETLRLLSPNAVMVRVTSRGVVSGNALLPAGCEIILVPFLAHRDPAIFPRPALFQLERWTGKMPSVFEYLPFGAGIHACIGRDLAFLLIGTVIGEILSRVDPVLSHEQLVDWRIDITFRPRFEIYMSSADICNPDTHSVIRWRGPIAQLVEFQ